MNKLKTNNFNKIAGYYDALSYIVFRSTIKKSQLYFINNIPDNATVLIIGGGTGWYLLELLKQTKCKSILYMETSSEMINLSKNKISLLQYDTEVEFIEDEIEKYLIKEEFDIVITNFILDVFKEEKLKIVMHKLLTALKEDGQWLFCDFRINHTSLHKYWQIMLTKAMYAFFKITTGLENNKLLPFDKYFQELSLVKLNSKSFFSGMIESSVYKKYS